MKTWVPVDPMIVEHCDLFLEQGRYSLNEGLVVQSTCHLATCVEERSQLDLRAGSRKRDVWFMGA